MWKAVIKGLLARKLRLALTSLAVVLGIGFVAGIFVLTDTMNKAFDNAFAEFTEGIDAYVRAGGEADATTSFSPPGIPERTLELVRDVEGVDAAYGSVQGFAQLVDGDGEAIAANGGSRGPSA
jgi:putative ABC transport system permease protein